MTDDINRDLLKALQAIGPLLAKAIAAYQFSANSYSYDALLLCGQASDMARAAIAKATPPAPAPTPETIAPSTGNQFGMQI